MEVEEVEEVVEMQMTVNALCLPISCAMSSVMARVRETSECFYEVMSAGFKVRTP